ncbi:type II toxin-antitoxin system Phd/YefM family antitoxin [Derxia gummosa]|uniref:Type II toxin-antitoxin system Phd/YefM family antitoxin n=1 Tax=Derxia gummosa DSM 723 TaxID=1121388 RepID=A0A8B6X4D4_9BURK|nr:type II toxin-antitoxin system Phd/YefM family antitoxin [Derxia gummosa]
MPVINLLQAETTLSRLIDDIEQGRKREIVIVRNGRPAAKLVPIDEPAPGPRIGVAKGRFDIPDSIDEHNDEVARLFVGAAP